MKKDLDFFFKKASFQPNERQREAIFHYAGPLFITAGPGAGKTRVLLWRTLNLIVFHDIDPSEIFLSTFTEKAALQLHDGLRAILALITNETGRPFDLSAMAIGTVHSLCRKLLVDRRFAESPERRRAPVLLDELGQYFRVYNRTYWKELLAAGGWDDEEAGQREINEWFSGRDSYSRHFAALSCIAFFNRLSEEDYDVPQEAPTDPMTASLLVMYSKYRKDLASEGAIEQVDFSLLQKCAYRYFLEGENAASVFRHVIVDEYQDTNSIQEKIFFRLASGHGNICVVGDDDQALYRFRGATVENLVDFEKRCSKKFGTAPKRVDLNVNYRSRRGIVALCGDFIDRIDWTREDDPEQAYRIMDKAISAHSSDDGPAVVVSAHAKGDIVYGEIARFIKRLKELGKIEDYNQAALLFPAMKGRDGMNTRVHGFIEALKAEGIPYYAPRAGRFLEVEEAKAFFGLCQHVFGRPSHRGRGDASQGYSAFQDWMTSSRETAERMIAEDSTLAAFVKDRRREVEQASGDCILLLKRLEKDRRDLTDAAVPGFPQALAKTGGLSLRTQKALQSHNLGEAIKRRQAEGRPYALRYVLGRVTALDWTILDLFYQLNGFEWFRSAYDAAERGEDEGPICNLGLVTQYLARFTEEYSPILTGQSLIENRFVNNFFSSFLYALFRLGESEFENAEDPFPKGRVPFLTIHQAKGLEFPVVVLGSVYREPRKPSRIETTVRELLEKEGEPLERMDEFDTMRAFYVGLSRARGLLALPRYTYAKNASPAFKAIFDEEKLPSIESFDVETLPSAAAVKEDLGKSYGYTSDYLLYRKCARNYMVFRKYGFVPSRGQTMFFGSLVHETLEDLHHLVMAGGGKEGS